MYLISTLDIKTYFPLDFQSLFLKYHISYLLSWDVVIIEV